MEMKDQCFMTLHMVMEIVDLYSCLILHFLKHCHRSFGGKLVWVFFGIFNFCLLRQGLPSKRSNSSFSCLSLPNAQMTGMHYHVSEVIKDNLLGL